MTQDLEQLTSWPHTLFDRAAVSADLLPLPFAQFDQKIHWEADIWPDPDSDGYGVTFWEPELADRLPSHLTELTLSEAIAEATEFARHGGMTDFLPEPL